MADIRASFAEYHACALVLPTEAMNFMKYYLDNIILIVILCGQ
jgi:hypothetical protein